MCSRASQVPGLNPLSRSSRAQNVDGLQKWSQIWFNLILFRGVYELCIVLTSDDKKCTKVPWLSGHLLQFSIALTNPEDRAWWFFLLGLVIQPFPSRERAKWEFWKIIDSKVPAGMGYVIVPRRVATLNPLTTNSTYETLSNTEGATLKTDRLNKNQFGSPALEFPHNKMKVVIFSKPSQYSIFHAPYLECTLLGRDVIL